MVNKDQADAYYVIFTGKLEYTGVDIGVVVVVRRTLRSGGDWEICHGSRLPKSG